MSQPIDLSGVDAKLRQARKHQKALKSEIEAWIEAEPYGVWFDRNADGTEHSIRLVIREQTPDRFGSIFGDCVHNLRSALDHLIYAAAFAHCDGRLTSDRRRNLAFPICREPEHWTSRVVKGKWLDGVSEGMHDAVKRRQPYEGLHHKGAGDPSRHPLVLLDELDRADKHRLLNELHVEPKLTHFTPVVPIAGQVLDERFGTGVEHFENGTELAWVRCSEPNQHVNFQVKVQPTVILRYPPGVGTEPIGPISLLDDIEREVRGTIFILTPFA